MFGYVRVNAPELRVREAEYYRAVYCGLCRTMRKHLGITSAAALSYDTVFLILTRMALTGARGDIRRRRCFKLRSRPMMEPGQELLYGAGVSALLTSLKSEDDVRDERGGRRMAARVGGFFSRRHLRRAGVDSGLIESVRSHLDDIYDLESQKISGERAFGELLGEVFSHGLDERPARIARQIGHSVGRCIYIIDAVDDIAEDEKSGRWNPARALWDGMPKETACEAVREAVRLTLSSAGTAAELIDGDSDAAEIVRNILFSGIPLEADRVIEKWKNGEDRKS